MPTMPKPKVRAVGWSGLIAQPREIDFDPVRGEVVRDHFEAIASSRAVDGMANTCRFLGRAFRTRGGARQSIEVVTSGNPISDNSQSNWQLLGNVGQRSIFKSALGITAEAEAQGSLLWVKAQFEQLL